MVAHCSDLDLVHHKKTQPRSKGTSSPSKRGRTSLQSVVALPTCSPTEVCGGGHRGIWHYFPLHDSADDIAAVQPMPSVVVSLLHMVGSGVYLQDGSLPSCLTIGVAVSPPVGFYGKSLNNNDMPGHLSVVRHDFVLHNTLQLPLLHDIVVQCPHPSPAATKLGHLPGWAAAGTGVDWGPTFTGLTSSSILANLSNFTTSQHTVYSAALKGQKSSDFRKVPR